MFDTTVAFLLHQIIINAVFRVQICIHVHFTDIVEHVKIKILHLTLFQLILKNLFYLRHIGQVISRKLGSQIKTAAVIFFQQFTYYKLGFSTVITVCGIIIVNAGFHAVCKHFLRSFYINLIVVTVDNRQSHISHSKSG